MTEPAVRPSLGVAIIEDSAMLGELIEEAVVAHPLLHLTGRVRTIREAQDAIPWAKTDLASIDLHLPDGLGITLGKQARVSYPSIRVLILSDHRRPSLFTKLEQTDLTFWSYALKSSIDGREHLAEILHRSATRSYIDPEVQSVGSKAEEAITALSEQQRHILDLVSRGLSNAKIGERLGIGDKTVEYHLKQIYQACDLPPSSEANQRVLAAVAYLQRYAPDRHI